MNDSAINPMKPKNLLKSLYKGAILEKKVSLLDRLTGFPFPEADRHQSSKNLAAAPLLSPLMSRLSRLMDVPCVANQLNAPMLSLLLLSTNFNSVICVSTLVGYRALSSAGLSKYALGLRLMPALSTSPIKNRSYQDRGMIRRSTKCHPY